MTRDVGVVGLFGAGLFDVIEEEGDVFDLVIFDDELGKGFWGRLGENYFHGFLTFYEGVMGRVSANSLGALDADPLMRT